MAEVAIGRQIRKWRGIMDNCFNALRFQILREFVAMKRFDYIQMKSVFGVFFYDGSSKGRNIF